MNIQDYIINDIEPLAESETLGMAQDLFSQTTYSHVPVMQDDIFLGCLAENDVHCHKAEEIIGNQKHLYEGFFVKEETNWLDILEIFAQNSTNIMPVLDDTNHYLGYYELSDVMSYFNNTPFLSEHGSIIVVERGVLDYSFSEICQIIESNDGKVLGLFISKMENDVVQISIKLGTNVSFNDILQAFRRYGYVILSNHQEDAFIKDLRDRSNYLEKYLNI
ncbi:CBS domain-containing protein [Leeuwenhoekiella sp. A16]|uniref:CBS domain-containing protein n=1 Tax=unclassified Leeuwenhoekiella TaxID=2615029 RepID=UPI003A802A80